MGHADTCTTGTFQHKKTQSVKILRGNALYALAIERKATGKHRMFRAGKGRIDLQRLAGKPPFKGKNWRVPKQLSSDPTLGSHISGTLFPGNVTRIG